MRIFSGQKPLDVTVVAGVVVERRPDLWREIWRTNFNFVVVGNPESVHLDLKKKDFTKHVLENVRLKINTGLVIQKVL